MKLNTFFFLLAKNYRQFRRDLKDYSKVNYYANAMPKYKAPKPLEEIKNLREVAQKNYDAELARDILK
jgi:hypothetical protein